MTGSITLDDFDIVRDSNGNLVIRDDTDTTVATYDNTADEWQFADAVSVTELIDGASVSHTGELADDGDAQPPESHDNTAHSLAFVSDGDGTERQIWVISNGASDPAGADPEDIIFEEEA